MSLERVIKALESLGLKMLEAEVYVYVAKNGPKTIIELDEALNYSEKRINVSLRTLIEQALVIKEGTNFSAIPFEEALERLIKREKQQSQSLQKSRNHFLVTFPKKTEKGGEKNE